MTQLIALLFIIGYTYAKNLIPSSLNIHITSLKQCDTDIYPIQVSNITVELQQGKVMVSGTMSTSVELTSPVTAAVKVKKRELGLWIEIPCVDEVGSCTYKDLCKYGTPTNSTCPKTFADNSVPCRCPIPKGTYTIPSMVQIDMDNYFSVYSGTYWAEVSLSQENTPLLGCYVIYFTLEDENLHTGDNNEIIPFVDLV